MKNNLPNNWTVVKLGSIVKVLNSGFACGMHNSTGDGISHLRPMNVTSKGAISLKDLRSVSSSSYDKLVKGDVLFNNTNSTELVGKTAYIEEDTDWGYSNHMTRLRFDSNYVNSKFVSYYLHNLFYEGYFRANCNNHVSQASISAKFLANEVSIPLPPFAEQNRIVAQLEATMQKLEASQERLENLPALLKKFRQAVLAAAVSGKLTEAWRTEQAQGGETGADLLNRIRAERRTQWEEKQRAKHSGKQLSLNDSWKQKYEEPYALSTLELPDLPNGWTYATLLDISTRITDGTHQPPKFVEAGIPFIFVKHIMGGAIDFNDTRFISLEEYEQLTARCPIEKGDVLYSAVGSYGTAVPVETDEPFTFQRHIAHIKPNNSVLTRYVVFYLNSVLGLAQAHKVARGVAQKTVTLGELSKFTIGVPPLAEQQEIVRQVNHYFTLADQLEARFEQAAAMVEQLPQALLAKAFSGQLVPQDPNDEPASALLERLKTEAPAPPKGKRGRTPKAMTESPLFN